MQIKNGKVFLKDGTFENLNVTIENDVITDISSAEVQADAIDAKGMYVVPGYVDIHIHGADGCDCCDGTKEAFKAIGTYLAKQGVTTFIGTTMAYDEGTLTKVAETVKDLIENPEDDCAKLRGINMEGPFFSMAKRGAQNPDYIINPDYDFFNRVNEKSGRNVKVIDVAPELDGAMDFISKASKDCAVSIAHTESDYDTAVNAFKNGANHVTHLFNAMPPFNHRDPGVIGAAADYADYIELICDGIHLHPAMLRSVFKLFGNDKVCMISDSMQACGLPDGEYSLGGQKVYVSCGKATLESGTIAGSTTNLAEAVRRAVSFGISLNTVLKAATINPAKSIGIDDKVGSIEVGKQADIVILDESLTPVTVIIGGKVINK